MKNHKNPPGAITKNTWNHEKPTWNLKKTIKPTWNQHKPTCNHEKPILNCEKPWKLTWSCTGWWQVVTGGHPRLQEGSDHFSWHTDKQTLHHNIYIIAITIIIVISNNLSPSSSPSTPSRSLSKSAHLVTPPSGVPLHHFQLSRKQQHQLLSIINYTFLNIQS